MLKFTLMAALAGIVVGWWGGNWAIMQSWWPWSISGQKEVVMAGRLEMSPPGSEVGLTITSSSGQSQLVDASRVPSEILYRFLRRPVAVRGIASSTGTTDYVLITRLTPGFWLWVK